MALPRSRAKNRGRGGSTPIRGSAYDNPAGAKVGGNPQAEHDYTNWGNPMDRTVSYGGETRGPRRDGIGGAGEQNQTPHMGGMSKQVSRYANIDVGMYPMQPVPPGKPTSKMDVYPEGGPGPARAKNQSFIRGANNGKIQPRARAR